MNDLEERFGRQHFSNGYLLVDGVAMHEENGDRFQIPPDVIKKHVRAGQFVEIRIDSPRFSVHQDSVEKCYCASCSGETSKPILCHQHPASLVTVAKQPVPSRGWGEDFWVRITDRSDELFQGVVDNLLYETRLHGVSQGSELLFHQDHILAVHDIHRQELAVGMDAADLSELAQWLKTREE